MYAVYIFSIESEVRLIFIKAEELPVCVAEGGVKFKKKLR